MFLCCLIHNPASPFQLVDFIPLTPPNTGIADQGLKVSGAGGGHHHSSREVGEDGEGRCAYLSYSAFPEVKNKSLATFGNVIDLPKTHEVSYRL